MEWPGRWIALIGRTPADVRDYMIEGPGGILRNAPGYEEPHYEPSKRRLTWPNGSWATIYSGDEPDQVRGFSGDTAWLDEMAKYRYARESWDNLQFGLREASVDKPRRLITTTPRPLAVLRDIEAMPSTITVRGSSYENRANLDPDWFKDTIAAYENTRIGRQEIHAEILDDVPGALWTRQTLERASIRTSPPMRRIVVAVDPSGTEGEEMDDGDAIGIIVAGLAENGHYVVLEDLTAQMSPADWARTACFAYMRWEADLIVAEKNFGGAMVRHTIQSFDENAPVRLVTASRAKHVRAEPVAALYEQGRAKHVGSYAELEDEMIMFTRDGYQGENSPNRADAMVWAMTELMSGVGDDIVPAAIQVR